MKTNQPYSAPIAMAGRMTLVGFGVLAMTLLLGCGKGKVSDEAIPVFEEDELTNLYPREKPDDTPRMPPQVVRQDEVLELTDLNLVLRKVNLIGADVPVLFFSETEITNAMYAAYLADTQRWRDDTAVERAAAQPTGSTASPSLQIADRAALWRNGAIPAKRDDHPVSLITIVEAMQFCKWMDGRYKLDGSFRLPTSAEWLFAAYGPDRKYPWGDEVRDVTGKS